ncbi:hypothetical protein B0T20DRAFT_154102 [Sordaria brevicollis]|uniref:Uncharacterized protein n=1 Tax=Sordaria brevicollis TaxID=83679 RepID=A0AAE0PJB7_SORBR|nr:hypothetical protein B0T20DRAFT_154102 [Sordaria brevicollis]
MGIQVESSIEPPRSSFAQQYGPWHYHDVRSSRYGWGEGAALISNAFTERFAGVEGSKSKARPTLVVEEVQEEEPETSSASVSTVSPEPVELPPTASPWALTILTPTTSPILTFPLAPIQEVEVPPRPSLKRARPSTDVDGHNTSPLPCKKRRLRLNFVTSRLSQPFSLPATHILNRESILKGDKRLRSIAAAANRRMAMAGWGLGMGGNGNAAMLRKMAVMNRFRMRMLGENLARAQAAQQAAQAQAQEAGRGGGGGSQPAAGEITGGVPMQRSGTRSRPPSGPVTGFPPPVIHTTTTTIASPGPSAPTPHRLSPSPRLRPQRSPDLRPIEDDLDDEDVAFPTSAHESRYEGEDEEEGHEVYADFGVLFGGGGEEDLDDEEDTGVLDDTPAEQQELGLDDLDGIPWGARC